MKTKMQSPANSGQIAVIFIMLAILTFLVVFTVLYFNNKTHEVVSFSNDQPGTAVFVQTGLPAVAETEPLNTAYFDSINRVADFLAVAKEMNGDKYSNFTTEFTSGSASSTRLSDYLTKTSYGHLIKVASSSVITSPTIYNGNLYVSGGFGSKSYFKFDGVTGKLLWGADITDDGPSSCAIRDSILIFNTESCTIFALNTNTGEHLWSKWMGDPMMSSPMISGDYVYTVYPGGFGGGFEFDNNLSNHSNKNTPTNSKHAEASHIIACINIYSGKIAWQRWLDGDVISSPVAEGNFVYLTTFSGTVYKFAKKDGEIKAAMRISATSSPSVSDDKIFITKRADRDKKVCEATAVLNKDNLYLINEFNIIEAPYLDANVQNRAAFKEKAGELDAGNGFGGGAPASANAEKAMKNLGYSNVSSLQTFTGSVVLKRKNNLINCSGDVITCTKATNGEQNWSHKIGGDIKNAGGYMATTPIVAGNYIITVTLSGNLKALDMATGEEIVNINLDKEVRTQPVVNNGWIYVPTTTGEIACVDTKNTSITGWPTLLGNFERNINF